MALSLLNSTMLNSPKLTMEIQNSPEKCILRITSDEDAKRFVILTKINTPIPNPFVGVSMDSEAGFCDGGWSEEYDCVPLRLRFKDLRQINRNPDFVYKEQCKLRSQGISGSVQTVQDSWRDSSNALLQGSKIKPGFDDSLDDIVLAGRRRMLLSWKLLQSSGKHMKDAHNGESSKSSEPLLQGAGTDMQENANAIDNPPMSFFAKVKEEPVDVSVLYNGKKNDEQNIFSSEILPVKSETEYDELDHIPLIDRMKLISSGKPNLDESQNVASDMDVGIDVLESAKPISISRPRKRRKTATDSAEIALEEDAPGLLKILMERGISAEEIKLYGQDDGLDDSFSEDGFAELEAVISQVFSQRQPCMKFPVVRCSKGAKANYCLSCLLSLVEQTRYLQLRKWPVEWGWCRDLQSFIFVFRRHNRIVLERPEYGFATYFFELLNSVPVDWQVKRLVTAMKLTNCGRITLLENKPLTLGDDLSEGEARVLTEYGWIPNTGLGTMLNFCDRVVHDRKQDTNSSEWRSKIASQLMNGYNGGNIITRNLPKKVLEFQGSDNIQVKVEES